MTINDMFIKMFFIRGLVDISYYFLKSIMAGVYMLIRVIEKFRVVERATLISVCLPVGINYTINTHLQINFKINNGGRLIVPPSSSYYSIASPKKARNIHNVKSNSSI